MAGQPKRRLRRLIEGEAEQDDPLLEYCRAAIADLRRRVNAHIARIDALEAAQQKPVQRRSPADGRTPVPKRDRGPTGGGGRA